MAGSPKKRARRAAQEAQQLREQMGKTEPEIPDAVPAPSLNLVTPPDARAQTNTRARTQARNQAPGRPPGRPRGAMAPGPELRAAVDHLQAQEIAKLAGILKPGLCLYLERLRPAWCSGWIENYEIQDGRIDELLEYLSDEYGGQQYRVVVSGPDGQPYFDTRLKIAGPPRDRGRIISRARWESRDQEAEQRPATGQGQGRPGDGAGTGALITALGDMFKAVLDTTTRTADKTMEAVRQLNENQQSQTSDLIKTIVGARERAESRASFAEQLNEVREANEALKEVKDALREPVPPDGNDGGGQGPLLEAALHTAAAEFMGSVMRAKMTRKSGAIGGPKKRRGGSIDLSRPMVDARISGRHEGGKGN